VLQCDIRKILFAPSIIKKQGKAIFSEKIAKALLESKHMNKRKIKLFLCLPSVSHNLLT
jgi:hypothetical protein